MMLGGPRFSVLGVPYRLFGSIGLALHVDAMRRIDDPVEGRLGDNELQKSNAGCSGSGFSTARSPRFIVSSSPDLCSGRLSARK